MEQDTHTPLTVDQLVALHSNLNPNRVSRLQNGMSYLEAWDVKATLIRMFGYAGFSAECLEAKILRTAEIPQSKDDSKMNWAISAQATVRLTIHQTGAVYTESAIATSKQPDWGESADMALKSAESDALKRAAIYLGTQFGLSLYDDGKTSDIIQTTLSPGQGPIMDMINASRRDDPEATASLTRLQNAMKVHAPTVTEVPTVIPVATITSPVAVPVAKALENAERVAKELDAAERQPTAREQKVAKLQGVLNTLDEIQAEDAARSADPEVDAPRQRQTSPKRGRATKPTVTADKAAVARQALATAHKHVGLGDPYEEQNFAMDDARQVAEDSGR